MAKGNSLERFIKAQDADYQTALSEIRKGRKQSHWTWYIFPQIQGLGISETSKFYVIKDMDEAREYLDHPVLGNKLVFIAEELLKQDSNDANQIFGSPDDLKLRSSMTLFASLPDADPVFQQVLDKFFNGEKDEKTLRILKKTD
ncbi:MAG TPA: DUF1810 domain-containing protein [Pedobacter sp.]